MFNYTSKCQFVFGAYALTVHCGRRKEAPWLWNVDTTLSATKLGLVRTEPYVGTKY